MENNNDNNIEFDNEKKKKARKISNLINTVENHTRTERHLEQYSHIGDPKYKEKARNKQEIREKEIDELKHQLVGDNNNYSPTKKDQIEDIKENYELDQSYIKSNKDHMNQIDLKNLEKRQENRKIQLENLKENVSQNK